ncbi:MULTISPECIES: hypothetical protein [Methanobacterium]|nr:MULTISPECIES: hypothetical protein [Methanobacterium]
MRLTIVPITKPVIIPHAASEIVTVCCSTSKAIITIMMIITAE